MSLAVKHVKIINRARWTTTRNGQDSIQKIDTLICSAVCLELRSALLNFACTVLSSDMSETGSRGLPL